MKRALAIASLFACSSPPAATVRTPEPRPARSPVLARFPNDVWAVASVDLQRLRDGSAWRWLREFVATQSHAVHTCVHAFDRATRATIALRSNDTGKVTSTTFAIVEGVERDQLAACLHAPPPDVPEPPVGKGECDRYDAAVHELHVCGVTPLSAMPALVEQAAALGSGEPREACARAADVVERANKRRVELGWECEHERSDRGDYLMSGSAVDIDRDTIALGGYEIVHFLDDHTVELVNATSFNGGTDKAWARAALAEMSPTHHARWFDAPLAALDRNTMAWFVAKPANAAIADAPALVSGRVWLGVGVGIDLRIEGPSDQGNVFQWIGIAEHVASDPEFAGASLHIGCAVTPPERGREQQACESAIAHTASIDPAAAHVDFSGLVPERVERCVADHWPASLLQCLDAAKDHAGTDACYAQLSASERDRVQRATGLCGSHPIEVRAEIPQMRVEALKLVSLLDRQPRQDCRIPTTSPVSEVAIGTLIADDKQPAARACFESTCEEVTLGSGRFEGEVYWIHKQCIGPFTAGNDLAWSSPGGGCDFTRSLQPGTKPAPFTVASDAKAWRVCRDKDCTAIPKRLGLEAMSIGPDLALAAVMFHDGTVETWSLAKHAKVGSFRAMHGCMLAVAGGSLALGCPQGAYLATPAGKRIAAIAGNPRNPIWLGGTRWAFVDRTGDKLSIQDAVTGKLENTIALGRSADSVEAAGDGAGSVVVAYGGAGATAGTIVVVGPTGAVASYQRSACPADPAPHR